MRLREAVVNVGAQSVQRQTPLQVPLGARNLGSVETARDPHLDSLPAEAQRLLDRLSHSAAEGNALLKLRGHLLGLKLRVQLGLVYLLYGDEHFLARARGDVCLELVY